MLTPSRHTRRIVLVPIMLRSAQLTAHRATATGNPERRLSALTSVYIVLNSRRHPSAAAAAAARDGG